MGYYMRFITNTDQVPSLDGLDAWLKTRGSQWQIASGGDLRFGDALLGELEINRPGDGLFEEELGELRDFMGGAEPDESAHGRVTEALERATTIIALRVLWQGRDAEDTLDMIDPLWETLFERLGGLLQADGEGYYDEDGLVLAVD